MGMNPARTILRSFRMNNKYTDEDIIESADTEVFGAAPEPDGGLEGLELQGESQQPDDGAAARASSADIQPGVGIFGPKTREEGSGDDPEKTKMELYDWVQCIVSAIICGIFIFVFVGRTIGVEGDSMRQTLHWHDRVIMTNLFYTPRNGDIIIFRSPTDKFGGTPLVKRVIAVENEVIDINFETGDVFVNGSIISESYISELTHSRMDFRGPEVVPEGHVFVMGDNRNSSSDSRCSDIGMVDTRYILGRVLFIAVPGGDEVSPRDWSRFGFVN
jgi:signal peptidase I